MKEKYNIDLTSDELELNYYPEGTYNKDKNEIYVDICLEQANITIKLD
jgi:hypothetical protein